MADFAGQVFTIAAIVVALTLCSTGDGAEPFVAGFDRFGRHGEIDEQTAGRLLLSELSCTACHAADDPSLEPKRGPRLDGVADRLNLHWVRQFLLSPGVVKPGTTMPDVLAGLPAEEREQAASALIAFLSTQHAAYPELKAGGGNPVVYRFWNKGDQQRGRELYHQVGCVACHEPDADYETSDAKPSSFDALLDQLDPEEIKELGLASAARPTKSVPHSDLAAKFSRKSLAFFLLNPELTRPAGRMPSLKLTPSEAADVAAWLLRDQQPTEETAPADDAASLVDEGRRLFGELRCASCHSAGEVKPVAAKPISRLDPAAERSCIGRANVGLPHYVLDASQTAAVRSALKATAESSSSSTPDAAAQVRLAMLKLNCFACHERDGQGGVGRNRRAYFETVGNVDIGDEGRLPPPLTGVGRKLQAAWMARVLAGTEDVRPYMTIRMPRFPAPAVDALPKALETFDRSVRDADEPSLSLTDEPSEVGRKLMDVGCVQCHLFRGEGLPGVVGVDLARATNRLRPEWFLEFLLDPNRLKPRTRMPTFFPGGTSQSPTVLGGDPQRQISAMWAYLKAGEKQPLPEKIEAARRLDFELKPTDRPIILRTFMPEAGTHAIAVGFPDGVHFAFDAENMRLAQAWRGRFLDAQGTWFSRFTPPAEPLGDDVVTFPSGVPFAWLKNPDEPWPANAAEQGDRFEGYRLDAAGVPTFLYHLPSVQVEDRIEPDGNGGLKRQIVLRPDGQPPANGSLWFRTNVGRRRDHAASGHGNGDASLRVSVADHAEGRLRETGEATERIVPVPLNQRTKLEVKYSW